MHVYSTNGERWTDVDQIETASIAVYLNAECKYEGSGNKAYRGSLSVPGFAFVGQKEPPNFLIPHANRASGLYRWDGGSGQNQSPVEACNAELDKRVANSSGKSKYDFLAQGFTVNFPAALRVSYNLTCKPTGLGFTDSRTRSTNINARIKCSASAQAAAKLPSADPKPSRLPIRSAKIVPLLKTASFEADPEVHTADCPAPIRFVGSLTANRAGTTTYQYVSKTGKKSPVFSMKFDGPGTQATRAWQTTVSAPKAGTTLAAPGSNASPNDIQGWYRLDVLTPEPKGSLVAHYRVMCGADDENTPVRMQIAPVEKTLEIKPQRAQPATDKR